MPQAVPVLAQIGTAVGSVLFPAATASIGLKIASVAAWTALSAGANALLSSQRDFPNQGTMLNAGVTPDLPRRWQIGTRANAGVFVDWYTSGHKNQDLFAVFYLGEGPMGPIKKIVADGRTVWTGTLNHGSSVQLTEFDSPDERMRIHYHDGRVGQTVNSALNAAHSVGANYTGTGCAYVIVEASWDPDTVPSVPVMTYETDGALLYDRTKDSTAGGTGTHRLNDPSTWEASNNPAVALDHYLLGNYWPGMTRPRLGVGLDPSEVPYDRFAAQKLVCDETVTVAAGSQTRYEANGFIEADQDHASVITELCKAMDCRPADFGGRVSFISNEAKTSVLTITDDDVIENVPETYQPKRSYGELVGSAAGMYQDPANNFNPTEYPAVEDAVWETEDGGIARRADFSLPFETNAARAQRLARRFVLRERRQAILSGLYMPRVLELEEGDWFTRTGDRFPGGKTFEVVQPPQLNPNTMEVTMSAVEVDPSDSAWNHATDEQAVNTGSGDTNNSPPALPVPVVTFSTFNYSFGQYNFSSCQFNHTEWNLGPVDIDIEIDESNGAGAPLGNNRQQDFKIPANRQYVSVTSLLPGKVYVVRVRARAGLRQSAWSAWDEFTAGATAQYGPVGTNGAQLGTNLYAADGTTLLGDSDVITDQGTAAAIASQGGLATRNDVTWVTDFASYPGDAAVITAQGIASAIAGQGGQATANATRGALASRPASPPEGSWYTDTDNDDLYFYTSSAWYKVADFRDSSVFTASHNTDPITASSSSTTFSTGNISINTSNGTPSYSYITEIVDSTSFTPKVTVSSPTAVQFQLTATNMNPGESESGTVRSIVVDANGKTAAVLTPFTMTRT